MTDINWPYMVIEVELATRTANGIARYPLVRTWQGGQGTYDFRPVLIRRRQRPLMREDLSFTNFEPLQRPHRSPSDETPPSTLAGWLRRARGAGFSPISSVPELAMLVERAPEGDAWLHEVKLDGYRVAAGIERGKVRMLTRHANDWTPRFRRIAAILADLPV